MFTYIIHMYAIFSQYKSKIHPQVALRHGGPAIVSPPRREVMSMRLDLDDSLPGGTAALHGWLRIHKISWRLSWVISSD